MLGPSINVVFAYLGLIFVPSWIFLIVALRPLLQLCLQVELVFLLSKVPYVYLFVMDSFACLIYHFFLISSTYAPWVDITYTDSNLFPSIGGEDVVLKLRYTFTLLGPKTTSFFEDVSWNIDNWWEEFKFLIYKPPSTRYIIEYSECLPQRVVFSITRTN